MAEVAAQRLRRFLEAELEPRIFAGSAPLELTAWCARGEPVGHAEATGQRFVPLRVGDLWGPPWSTTWIRVRGAVPPAWSGRKVVAMFDLGFDGPTGFTCEALAWRSGRPWRGVDPNHRWLPVDTPQVDFLLEAAANPTASVSGRDDAESMIALRAAPQPAFTLRQAELRLLDEVRRKDALDFRVLLELAEALPDGARREEIVDALERFAATGESSRLEGAMRPGAAPSHIVHAVGHAHIDTAWLWPLREARRKCARSFSTQLALMEEYPDHRFACSQPAQYAWMKEAYPTIYEGIRERVATGQWEPVGAMWVEADCNLPSGEALARQLLHGKRFFMRELGYETKELWLPDVFGYPASLPQLIAAAGCDYFLTQKLSWNETNKPAHHTFVWEGIDGSRIFTHFPPADTYNGDFSASEVLRSVARFKDRERSSRSLYPFGWGDGGGGPDADMLESARRLRDLDGAPRVELSSAAGFFSAASAEAHDLATVKGELYFELHRGTYTSQGRMKWLNRRAQESLREAETWSSALGSAYPAPLLEETWKTLLLNQFHDILPGSSIDWVYEEAERDLEHVVATCETITRSAIQGLAGDGETLVAFNVNSHPRLEVVEVDGRLRFVAAPASGWAAVNPDAAPPDRVVVAARRMENRYLRVEWDEHGLLTSVWDKDAAREALGGRGNVLQLHEDNPRRWDAWDIDAGHRDTAVDVTDVQRLEVEAEPLRAVLRIARQVNRSTIAQRMVLDAGSRVLRFETEVDWHERHRMLKVAFPVSVAAPEATYEIQFGHVGRPTHMETSQARAMFEVCAQRWADLGDGQFGVALLNDSRHGYDVHGSVMKLSLLRSPTHPDPSADQGAHRFTYALMPHRGDFRHAGVIQAGEDLNAPLRVVRARPRMDRRSLVEVGTAQVIAETIKRAEDSEAAIVRLYEAWGRPCRTTLRTTLPAGRAFLCDLLERNLVELPVRDGAVQLDLGPFKVLTLKLEP